MDRRDNHLGGRKVPPETRTLIRAYARYVARRKHPDARIDVEVDTHFDDQGRVSRRVIISPPD